MTRRERILAVLSRRPADRLCWTALCDETTRNGMPRELRELPMLDFYRHLGCDILPFGNFGLPKETRFVPPARRLAPDLKITAQASQDGVRTERQQTPWGTLTATFRKGHPVKHPVETKDDLRVLRNVWESTRYEIADGVGESHKRIEDVLGDDGVFTQTLSPSPVQQLIEYDMGLLNFYALLSDHRREVEELLGLMHARRCQEYRLTAERSPARVIISVENTSSHLTSPDYYRRYSLPQLRDFVDIMRERGKVAILHMCGHLRALLPAIKETGLDGIHAMTPPPIGDTPWETGLDVLGEGAIIMGSLSMCLTNPVLPNPVDIQERLDSLMTDRLRRANLILCAGADGTPLPIAPFHAVRDWIEQKGQRRA